MSIPAVGIILVNYRGKADTLECLQSLRSLNYPNFFSVLVDNASGDGCPEAVRESFPEVTVIESQENLGFTGANNIGLRAALERDAEFLFLLNNDTTVHPNLLGHLVSALTMDQTLGVVGPTMFFYDSPEEVWATGGRINLRGDSTLLTRGERPDFIIGAGLMIRRDALREAGMLDERFFLYYEESDLCARVRAAGWGIGVAPEGKLWHKVSKTTGADSPLTLYYMRRNRRLYLQKHGTLLGRAAAALDDARLQLVWTLRGHPARRVLARAIADARAGAWGRADGAIFSSQPG